MSLQKLKLSLGCAAGLIFLVTHAGWAVSADPKNRLRKEIQLPELKERQLVAISPDSDMFHSGSGTFGEVRIVDEWGRSQPVTDWKANVPISTNIEGRDSFEEVKLRKLLPDGTTELRFRLPSDFAKIRNVYGVNVMPRCENFEVHARLYGVGPRPASANAPLTASGNAPQSAAADIKETRTLLSEVDLADYHGFLPLSQFDIPVKLGDFSEYLLVLDRPTFKEESKLIRLALDWGVPIRQPSILDRSHFINLWAFVGTRGPATFSKPKLKSTSPRSMKVTQDPATAMTLVDIETSGEPIVSMTPVFAEKNYYRSCTIDVDRTSGAGESQWEKIGWTDLQKIHYKDLSYEISEIGFRENAARKFRLKIDNSYLPPLDLQEIKCKYTERELVFFAEPGQKLWIEYGDKTWIQPVEYVGPIQILLNAGTTPAVATLGPEQVWESPGPFFNLLKQPWLWGVGFGCFIILAICGRLTIRTLRKPA